MTINVPESLKTFLNLKFCTYTQKNKALKSKCKSGSVGVNEFMCVWF